MPGGARWQRRGYGSLSAKLGSPARGVSVSRAETVEAIKLSPSSISSFQNSTPRVTSSSDTMVAISTSMQSAHNAVGLSNAPASGLNKCRYKTGKCTNVRSNKRNGQPHQLCLYHRDKANKIQRKFDRQKRQVARTKKARDTHGSLSGLASPSSISMLDMAALAGLTPMHEPAVSPAGSTYSTSSSMSFSSLASDDVIYTPDSMDCGLNESVWTDLPVAAASYLGEYSDMPMPTSCHQSYLSSDEIDFLCSAVLE